MPKRTNEFQQLVALVERALAPRGARVTESAELSAENEAATREIDVLIEDSMGPYALKIAVEAKDEQRKMDLTKFESLIGKYSSRSGVHVNQVVVISRNGFAKRVLERAAQENILLLTLKEAMVAPWATIPQRMTFSIEPHIAGLELVPSPSNTQSNSKFYSWRIVCECCGKDHGSPMQLAHDSLSNQEFQHSLRVAASKANSTVCSKLVWTFGSNLNLSDGETTLPIEQLTAHFHCAYSRGPLAVKAYERGDKTIHHLSGDFAGTKIDFVLPDGLASHQIAVKMASAPSESLQSSHSSKQTDDRPERILPQPTWMGKIISVLQQELSGLDVSVEPGARIHNFATGGDLQVPLLIKTMIGGKIMLRTVVIAYDGETEADADWVKEHVGYCITCEIDRLLLVSESEFTSSSHQLVEGCDNVLLCTRKLLESSLGDLDLAIPELWLWSHTIKKLECIFYSPSENQLSERTKSTKLVSPHFRMTLTQFHSQLNMWCSQYAFRWFMKQSDKSSLYTNGTIRFSVALPVESRLSNSDTDQVTISHLEGVITICGLLEKLDRTRRVEHDGRSSLEMFSSKHGFRRVRTAFHPRCTTIALDGEEMKPPKRNISTAVTDKEFPWFIRPGVKLNEVKGVHRVAKLKASDHPWSLQVLTSRQCAALKSASNIEPEPYRMLE